MYSFYATFDDMSSAESKHYKKPLTKRRILRKLNIEKKELKKKKKEAIADIEKSKKILVDMGYSNFVKSFEVIERLADDKDPIIRNYTLSFIEKLNNNIK